jgi:tetratricopeptide (TPR) repeat protein
MFNSLEMQIRELLLEFGEKEPVVEDLVDRWQRHLLSLPEQDALALFLLKTGFTTHLFKNLRRLIKAQLPLPWTALAQALMSSSFKLSKIEIQSIVDAISEQNAFKEVLNVKGTENWHPVLTQKKSQLKEEAASELIQRRQFLKEKMEFFRNQRMFSDEARILKELQALFPKEEDLSDEQLDLEKKQQSLEERWAREVIAAGPSPRDLEEVLQQKNDELTPEQVLAKYQIVQSALEAARHNGHLAYDIALHLHFMEMSNEALEALQFAEAGVAVDWLRVDLLLKAKHFVEALHETHQLERKYATDPESTFSAVYARALALWELGQKSMAIELVQNIVKIRPDYKSAHSLLMAWTGGDA